MHAVLRSLSVAPQVGYVAAVGIPVGITYAVAWLGWPPFIFEHLIVLLVVVIAIPWGLGPAIIAAVVSVLSDNVLLREPIGRPTITGFRDVLDLLLFVSRRRRRERTRASSPCRAAGSGAARRTRAARARRP